MGWIVFQGMDFGFSRIGWFFNGLMDFDWLVFHWMDLGFFKGSGIRTGFSGYRVVLPNELMGTINN
jgi:hypothetical protein